MFGRSESPAESAAASDAPNSPDKKGRPTPTRKEAEAAAKERARAGTDKKAAAKLLREKRAEQNRKMREGMKKGDEKFLPARDQGPVKRAVRDWVDSRLLFTEFVLPMLVIILILPAFGEGPKTAAGLLQMATMLLLVVDVVTVRIRLKRSLAQQFPGESLKGTTFYAITRMLQLRFMRLPKPAVKVGGAPRV